ncbi:hypothetical protein BDV93DRAFT_510069 [Ceratobasidium sp. AG-I]|nr:hypothetical protein BDV93DRAFT_510069 [Ceratobasidium sp. AG-I]
MVPAKQIHSSKRFGLLEVLTFFTTALNFIPILLPLGAVGGTSGVDTEPVQMMGWRFEEVLLWVLALDINSGLLEEKRCCTNIVERQKTKATIAYKFRTVTNQFMDVELRTEWIPGHVEVEGNGKADRAAKVVAKGNREEQTGVEDKDEEKLPRHLEGGISINTMVAKQTYKASLWRTWRDRLEGTE